MSGEKGMVFLERVQKYYAVPVKLRAFAAFFSNVIIYL
jgi:hypothetical protein